LDILELIYKLKAETEFNNFRLVDDKEEINFINKVDELKLKLEKISIKKTQNLQEELSNQKELKILIKSSDPPNKWEEISNLELDCICHCLFIKKDFNVNLDFSKPLIQLSQIESKVLLNPVPFSKGAMRYAFYMYDNFLNQKLVAKIPFKFSSNEEKNLEDSRRDLETIAVCQYIADSFNEYILNKIEDKTNLINFVRCFIYELKNPICISGLSVKIFQVENFIEGEYKKYNNNFGWVNKEQDELTLIAQSFSHFSWQFTKGHLLISDLQGVKGYLTDPQIHCLDLDKYGDGNLGYRGIIQFFYTHKCNKFCSYLNLLHPKDNKIINEDFDFFVESYDPPENPDEKVYKLCSLCRQPFLILKRQIYSNKINCFDTFCDYCEDQRNKTLKYKNICIDCKKMFTYSEYWFKMNRCAFPVRCSLCRLKYRNQLRENIKDN